MRLLVSLCLVSILVALQSSQGVLVSALTHGNTNGVDLTFSESLAPAIAENPSNYEISNGSSLVPIRSATVLNAFVVRLEANLPENAVYKVTVKNFQQSTTPGLSPTLQSPADIEPNSEIFLQVHGVMQREIWNSVSAPDMVGMALGQNFSFLTNYFPFVIYPADLLDFQPKIESPPTASQDYYGARVSGFLVPPVTDDYIFYLFSDNQSALFLSTDESPNNLRQIASEALFNGYTAPLNYSLPINLIAGKKYYLEGVFRDDTGGDCLRVYWFRKGERPAFIADGLLNGGLGSPIDHRFISAARFRLGPVTIRQHPTNQKTEVGGIANYLVEADGSPPFRYQWLKNGAPIAGATASTLVLENVSNADHAAKISVEVANGFSQVTSEEAMVIVRGAISKPALQATASGSKVVLSWAPEAIGYTLEYSEDMEPLSWIPIPNTDASSEYSEEREGAKRFYRLVLY